MATGKRREKKQLLITRLIAINDLYLRETAIHKQFRSHHIAAVVGREKNDGLRYLIGRADLPSDDTGDLSR